VKKKYIKIYTRNKPSNKKTVATMFDLVMAIEYLVTQTGLYSLLEEKLPIEQTTYTHLKNPSDPKVFAKKITDLFSFFEINTDYLRSSLQRMLKTEYKLATDQIFYLIPPLIEEEALKNKVFSDETLEL
jgi:hypothetical protein